tara:strand:- start:323 stop:796 length:474 start_codon:yes stop_codon:yes gene_type:complete
MNYEEIKQTKKPVPVKYKTLWLNTIDGVASADRKSFAFNNLPLIQIRNKSILKINSITLSGAGLGSASNHNWTIKMQNIKFNQTSYFNSDNDNNPTIACINYDTNNSIQNGKYSLELTPQDINQPILHIVSDDGHGAIKNSQAIDFHVSICIEEYEL